MMNKKFEITTGSGFKKNATDKSKELVKETYYAMKRKNLFYKFQQDFCPMRGINPIDENGLKTAPTGQFIIFGDVRYVPRPYGSSDKEVIPDLWHRLRMIRHMLMPKNFDMDWMFGDNYDPRMSRSEVLGNYADFYFRDYCKSKKVKPTGMFVKFMFGLFGVISFTLGLFWILSSQFSPTVVMAFGYFVALMIVLSLVAILFD